MNATIYRDAAKEHITVAALLQDNAAYVSAYYFAGLAVECLLRAHSYRIDPVFDARHDLFELARISHFFSRKSTEEVKRAARLLEDVTVCWSNTHRYCSDKALRSFLIKAGLHSTTVESSSLIFNDTC